MHFRGFLVVTPPGVTIDTDRPTERVGPHPPSEITATALPPDF